MKKFIVFLFSLSVLFGYYEKMCKVLPDKIDSFVKVGKCEGMDIKSSQANASQAVKNFEKGDKKISITLLSGFYAMQASAPMMMNMQMETNDMKMQTFTFKNFKCMLNYNKTDKNGALIVLIKQNPTIVMVIEFDKMQPEEAKKILNQINLKKIKSSL